MVSLLIAADLRAQVWSGHGLVNSPTGRVLVASWSRAGAPVAEVRPLDNGHGRQ